MAIVGQRLAEVGYSKDARRIELTVPYGTKFVELSKIVDFLAKDIITKLPRGCDRCHSGDHLLIRERLESVIRVDLDKGVVTD